MSFDPDFDEQLAEIRARAALMDELCDEVGRDPATLRRSFNLFEATARTGGGPIRYSDDRDLFARLVTELTALGFTDIGLYYPTLADQLQAFEEMANSTIGELRRQQ
ncbi:MAG: hypothetical protein P8N02_12670 [Actinomycetota bacterium]|nr:hypothetical protein [Actinomycetota bacterium]